MSKPFALNAAAADYIPPAPVARTSKKRPLVTTLEAPKIPKTNVEKENTRRLIVVLEQACLGKAGRCHALGLAAEGKRCCVI